MTSVSMCFNVFHPWNPTVFQQFKSPNDPNGICHPDPSCHILPRCSSNCAKTVEHHGARERAQEPCRSVHWKQQHTANESHHRKATMKIIEEPLQRFAAIGAERWVVNWMLSRPKKLTTLKQKRRLNSIPQIAAKLHTESLPDTEGIER